MSDHNRKTLRSFYCRDYLWDLFEVMTRDLGCSMDYLINEAMRHYARSRNYSFSQGMGGVDNRMGAGQPPQPPMPGGYGTPPAPAYGQPPMGGAPGYGANPVGRGGDHPTFQRMPAVQTNRPAPPAAAPYGNHHQQQQSQPPPAMRQPPNSGYQQSHRMSAPPPPPRVPPPPQPPPQYTSSPVPPPPPQPAAVPQQSVRPQLKLLFNNQRHTIDKDKFIIGRGSTMTDLTIRDGNISRKHAAVIYRNGEFYIKDLDSTNGIDYRGERIDSKKVEEGDVFNICDYELRFTYQ